MKKPVFSVILLTAFISLSAQPIALHPKNPHYFIYRGKPSIIVASGEHYGAVLNPGFDYIKYLNTLQEDGMNYTRIFTGTYFERAGSFGIEKNTLAPAPGKQLIPWRRSNEPGAVCGGNKFDLDLWDENYFSRLRSFIAEASKRGIIVEVSLFTSIYNYWDIQPWNPKNNISLKEEISRKDVQTLNNGPVLSYQERLVRRIIRELNEFDNVIYEIQNEPWADHPVTAEQKSEYFNRMDFREEGAEWRNKVEIADQASLDWQKRIASFITDEEKLLKNKHLIAQNYCNFYYSLTDVDPSVSILNFHYNYPVVVEQNYAYNRVIGFDESGFAGIEDVTYRKQAWSFMIAGGGLFNNLDYSFAAGYEDGSAVNKAPGGGSAELRKQLKVLSDFLHSFEFIKMKPDYEVVMQAPGAIARALSEKGKQYAIYLKNGTQCNLKLNIPMGRYGFEWINTADGSKMKSGQLKYKTESLVLESPAFMDDIALRIIRK